MKKIILAIAVFAFIGSSVIAATVESNVATPNAIELVSDQGEKTKSKDSKEEAKGETTEKESNTSEEKSSKKKSCKKSCDKSSKKSCDKKK